MRKLILSLILILVITLPCFASVKEISVYCINEATTFNKLVEDGQTVTCPNNIEHIVDTTSISIIRTIDPTINIDSKGRLKTIGTSRTNDATWTYYTTTGDSPDGLGTGGRLAILMTSEASIETNLCFLEDVEIHYGILTFSGSDVGDKFSAYVSAPATVLETWETGLKLMKYEIIPSSGLHLIIPAPEGYPGEVYQIGPCCYNAKIPIPIEAYNTDWTYNGNWDRPTMPEANPEGYYLNTGYMPNTAYKGRFNFYDFPLTLGYFVKNMELIAGEHGSQITLLSEDATTLYKGCKFNVKVENGNTSRVVPLKLAVVLKINRKTIR